MKSGLWILIAVVVAGIIVGTILKGRLTIPETLDDRAKLGEIDKIEDPEAKIAGLQDFILNSPESQYKSRAYSMIASEIVRTVKDTARMVTFARETIESEEDMQTKAVMYYWLYRVKSETAPEEASDLGRELLERPIDVGWIYNNIGYDLAERDMDLDLALRLGQRAVELAESREDSASHMDTRGWIHYKMARYEEAIRDLEEASALFKEPYEEMIRHLAYAYLAGGKRDKAFETFRSILMMGEYEYARTTMDSLMSVLGYTARDRKAFEKSLWEERMATAKLASGFDLRTIEGESHRFDPVSGSIYLLNFTSPT